MIILLAWILAAYGMTQIMVYGSIFASTREAISDMGHKVRIPLISPLMRFIHGIVSCMMCCSTWVGFFMGTVVYSPFSVFYGVHPIIGIFFDGMLASGSVWAVNAIVEWFEESKG
jgi:hypothetical protein